MIELESHFKEIKSEYQTLSEKLGSPELASNPRMMKDIAKKRSELSKIILAYEQYKDTEKKFDEARHLLTDPDSEISALAEAEVNELEILIEKQRNNLQLLLLPRNPNDYKNILIEIRAGTGGEEAALFAADLFRMYGRYAEKLGWKTEIIASHPTPIGGFKEIIFSVEGESVYSQMKFESGTHRVQRVPETEASGRIHTSAVTVAVLPEAEEVDVEIDPEDLRIDVYRSTGPGGQSVNTTDSAVRITHFPSGLVVSCQDEKSQHKNKAKALKVLRSRLLDMEIARREQKVSSTRRQQIGSGDRSERIRTYNFPQNRLTDHRIGLTLYKLELIMEGEIDDVIQALVMEDRMRKLTSLKT